MGDALKDYRSPLKQFYIPFYKNTTKSKQCFHILRYLHFCNNLNVCNKSGKDSDKLEELDLSFVGSVMLVLNFTVHMNI
jgi:hypothetical protein